MTISNQTPAIRMLMMLRGTRYFHAKFISRSTRIRGRVARTQNITKMKVSTLSRKTPTMIRSARTRESIESSLIRLAGKPTNGNSVPPPRNRAVARQLTANTPKYSARKKRPKRMLEYSV